MSLLSRRTFTTLRKKLFKFDSVGFDECVTLNSKRILLDSIHPGTTAKAIVPFDKGLLKALSCPLSGEELEFDEARNVLISKAIEMAFPINSAGIPLLLSRWAIPLEDFENKLRE